MTMSTSTFTAAFLLCSFFLLLLPSTTTASVFCSISPTLIDIGNDGSKTFTCSGAPFGRTKFLWRTNNNGGEGHADDEYYIRLFQSGIRLYSSSQKFDASSGSNGLDGTPGLPGYQVTFQCDLETSFLHCEDGLFEYKLVDCGCPDGEVPIEECDTSSYANAADAVCDTACDPGYFYNIQNRVCEECPNFQILATANVDYTGAVDVSQCGVPGASGFWSLAASGTVGAGGTVVQWSLARSQSASDGVERSNGFAQAYGQVRGTTTSFETSVSVGWTASVSAGLFGTSVGVESSVDFTATTGQEKSYEVSQESTNSIGTAVTSVITNTQEVTCSQVCGPDPNDPSKVNGFIFNYVEAIYDESTLEILHFVRTCATVCKNTNVPPLCPPGKCANRECDVCLDKSFLNAELDELASTAPIEPTSSPTRSPDVEPDSDDGGGSGGPPCFSEMATVQVEHQEQPVTMKDLQIGDKVLTADQTYETVYTFGHRHETRPSKFLRIHTTTTAGDAPLEITAEHLLFVQGRAAPVRADTVQVGDSLIRIGSDSVVQRIDTILRQGIYAPMTPSGTVVVDGVLASVYADTTRPEEHDDKNSLRQMLTQADTMHVLMSPLRFVCMGLSTDLCHGYEESTGYQSYIAFTMHALRWWETQHLVVQGLFLAVVLLATGLLRGIEILCGGPSHGPLVLLLTAVTVWKYRRNNSQQRQALQKKHV